MNCQNHLLFALEQFEPRLQAWVQSSDTNLRWFRRDPVAAMRAAGLDLDEHLVMQLESILAGIAGKLACGRSS